MKLIKRMFMSYDDMMKDILEENKERMSEEQYQKQMNFVNSGKFKALMATVVGISICAAPVFRYMMNQPEGKFASSPTMVAPMNQVGTFVNPELHLPGKSDCIVRAGEKVADYGDTLVNTMGCEVTKY